MFWQLGFILATASQAEKTTKDGICYNKKAWILYEING